MSLLDNHSQTLLFNLQRFQELGDKNGAGTIRSSCVSCFAHLAVLCEVLGRVEPTRTQLDTLCDLSLERLCELTRDTHMEEYTHLDLLLGVRAILLTTDQPLTASVTQVSWEKALIIFDAHLVTVLVEHGTKLQHWKETVADVYSDFTHRTCWEKTEGKVREERYRQSRVRSVLRRCDSKS